MGSPTHGDKWPVFNNDLTRGSAAIVNPQRQVTSFSPLLIYSLWYRAHTDTAHLNACVLQFAFLPWPVKSPMSQ